MTFGQKLTKLRLKFDISQEKLAELIGTSRQSVSKWEMEQALPKLDKILELSKFFGITCDELLSDGLTPLAITSTEAKKRYFGTDGFRGIAGRELTAEHAFKVGKFLGWYFKEHSSTNRRPRIVIGKDTRRSSYMLEYAIAAGITVSGADAYMLHVTTTPSVSYVTKTDGFDSGVMITASHNPYYDNGIKLVNRYGEKFDDEATALIEEYLNGNLSALGINGDDIPSVSGDGIGCIHDYASGRNRYIGYLISLASNSYKKLRIGLDCANGASWSIARAVFGALGAEMYVIGDEPDGLNINKDCGSTHVEALAKLVRVNHLDIGFAFDGDADRCIAVDECGNIVDGDKIMYLLAKRLKSRGMLKDDTVVATVMSNSGFINSLQTQGMHCIQTKVGDRFVYECMQEGGYSIGGEQSGHIIMKKYATTGDGILTAIMITEEICDTKSSLSSLVSKVNLYPQYLKNVRVSDKEKTAKNERVLAALREVEELIGNNGRALLRQSGTEPLVRIMIECESTELCRKYAEIIESAIRKEGLAIE